MKIYVINLDRSQDRLKSIADQFHNLHLEFERVPAIDGRALPEAELLAHHVPTKNWPSPLSPAEIGCFLSHRKCFELIANGEDDYAAIFEDDIRLSTGASALLTSTDWIPADSDIIKIDSYGHEVLISRPVKQEGSYQISRLRSRHLLAGGYIISRRSAQKLISLMQKATVPLDHFLFDPDDGPFNTLNIYQILPAIARQSGAQSTIGPNRSPKKRPSLLGLVYREIKRAGSRMRRNLKGSWANLTKTGRWGPIPVEHDIQN